jgi:hypothetical protein
MKLSLKILQTPPDLQKPGNQAARSFFGSYHGRIQFGLPNHSLSTLHYRLIGLVRPIGNRILKHSALGKSALDDDRLKLSYDLGPPLT